MHIKHINHTAQVYSAQNKDDMDLAQPLNCMYTHLNYRFALRSQLNILKLPTIFNGAIGILTSRG